MSSQYFCTQCGKLTTTNECRCSGLTLPYNKTILTEWTSNKIKKNVRIPFDDIRLKYLFDKLDIQIPTPKPNARKRRPPKNKSPNQTLTPKTSREKIINKGIIPKRYDLFTQVIEVNKTKSSNACKNCAWSVYLQEKKGHISRVTPTNKNARLHCYYSDKWATPAPSAIKYWDSKDIDYVFPNYTCNLWLSKNWKAELPRSKSQRIIPVNVKRTVWQRDKGQCVLCGSKRNLEYDHIIPHSQGGSNTERNIQILCQDCNRKKSNNI